MDALGLYRPLPTFTPSTLPNPKDYTDILIVQVAVNGTRTPYISDGTSWNTLGGGGSTAIGSLTGAGVGVLAALAIAVGGTGGMALLGGPALTGVPTAPTAAPGNNSTQLATTAYADAIAALKANLASPTLTGTPAAPTAAPATNTTQIATTAYADAIAALKANLASPTLTGTPLAPTAATGTNTTQIASTAFVNATAAVVPIVSVSAAKTFALGDAGTTQLHPAADTTARTWTIDANATVAFPIGTVITIDNESAAGVLTIAITTDTLQLVGAAGTTGSRTLASGGRAVIQKITSTKWRISGGAELT